MPIAEFLVNNAIRGVLHVICRIDRKELDLIPSAGPGIMVTNHSTNLEGPIYYVLLDPRKKTALGKRELWSHPVTRFFMQLWGIIPLNRGGPDRKALARAKAALQRGELLGIAPEGTRSASGQLQRGRPGAALLATGVDVPIIPMVQWGVQDLMKNLKRFRRTRVHFRVGEPFFLVLPDGAEPTRDDLRKMADEIMYQLAILLPKRFRGYYKDMSEMTEHYIRRIPAQRST
jgi:1-acyl-sn-glycerol-3-phosphate acyltransferase